MTFEEYYRQQLEWHSKLEHHLFKSMTRELPGYPPNWPGGFGPHYLQPAKQAIELMRPLSMLEIGFNLGRSAMLWLSFGSEFFELVSVDIKDHQLVKDAGSTIERLCPRRFQLVVSQDRDAAVMNLGKSFDTVFIDGEHDYENVMKDIALAKRLGIQKFIFDDWCPHWGPGVQPAIMEHRLKILAIFGNLACCQDIGAAEDWNT